MPAKPQPRFFASSEGVNRLKAAKARLNLTNEQIAEQAAVSPEMVSRLFNPKNGKGVSRASIDSIIGALGLQFEEIDLLAAPPDDGALGEALRKIQQALISDSTELDLSGLGLTSVPLELEQLPNLTELYLSDNQITIVPKELGRLINLKVLYIHDNQIAALPKELGQLTNLTHLSLDGNKISALPKELGQLSHLTEIYLSKNQITVIPPELGQLSNLTKLDIFRNQITVIPPELGQLSSLTKLYLHENQITVIPLELGQLSSLTKLDISENQITVIPPELGQLSSLKTLDISGNQITVIPPELGQLTQLTDFYLFDNQITTIPPELGQLTQLTRLFLHDNQQLGIPTEILGPTWVEVYRGATPASPQDILNYYFRIQADRQPLNEAKLILVGFGNVGKTSLVNCLVYQTFDKDEKKTEGIQITQWPLRLHDTEDITLNVWDFGGQEIMHSTHQFFLTERSLYVLVLNGRQGHEDTDAEYWLELIHSFGGDSPIIVVLNKIKEHPFDVNRNALKQKFPNIREFISTDCETNIGIDQLREIIERETDQLEHLRDPFPASWFEIKRQLASMSENYISFERYRTICQQDGESDFKEQDSLAIHLHNLGIALNYKDDPRLRDTHVLNPRWVTNGIYKLLNADALANKKGEIEIANLADILNPRDYPPERHGFVLELMRKFELCFPFQEAENRYLIPDLLDKQQPPAAADFDPATCLNFRYGYPILPEGLLPRFIVRTHVLSSQHHRWRTGVILEFEGNQALVKADRQDRQVTINVNGPVAGRGRLLAIIRSDFERIHSSFKFKPAEQVPVPAHPEVVLNYQDLVVMENEGLREMPVVANGKVVKLNVQDLLRGVDLEDSRRRRPEAFSRSQAFRLFYSYSHKDEALRDRLEVHLKLLQREGLVQNWHDRKILPGTDWKQELDANLEQADIILLLVSPDFIASDYCYEIEMRRALERHDTNQALVLPILIRLVDWNNITSLNRLQALPTDLKPVRKWTDEDEAWLNVEQGIRKAIKEHQARGRL